GRVGAPFSATIEIDNDTGGIVPLPLVVVDATNVTSDTHKQFIDPALPLFMIPGAKEGFGQFYTPQPAASGVTSDLKLSLVDLTQTIDWDSRKSSLRPSGMSADAWDAVWANLRPRLGNTVGDLYTLLFHDGSELHQNGEYIRSISELFKYEIREANDELPAPPAFQSIDLAFPEPGLPLIFGRSMVETVSGRYH